MRNIVKPILTNRLANVLIGGMVTQTASTERTDQQAHQKLADLLHRMRLNREWGKVTVDVEFQSGEIKLIRAYTEEILKPAKV